MNSKEILVISVAVTIVAYLLAHHQPSVQSNRGAQIHGREEVRASRIGARNHSGIEQHDPFGFRNNDGGRDLLDEGR